MDANLNTVNVIQLKIHLNGDVVKIMAPVRKAIAVVNMDGVENQEVIAA